jgi:hypothetical protein
LLGNFTLIYQKLNINHILIACLFHNKIECHILLSYCIQACFIHHKHIISKKIYVFLLSYLTHVWQFSPVLKLGEKKGENWFFFPLHRVSMIFQQEMRIKLYRYSKMWIDIELIVEYRWYNDILICNDSSWCFQESYFC